jgi:hypothetical protein
MNSVRLLAVALCAVSVGSCQSPGPRPSVDHVATYVRQRLDMVPVVPAREDVRVGDLFFHPDNPEGTVGDETRTETVLPNMRWSSVVLNEDLKAEFKDRPNMPSTPEEYAEDPAWPDSASEGPDEIGYHLRSVYLPGFSLSREQLDGDLPGYVRSLVFLEHVDDWSSIEVRIPSSESYSLDLEDLLERILEPNREGTRTQRLKEEHRAQLRNYTNPSLKTVYVRIVSEVLFVRAVQITVNYDLAFDDILQDLDDVEASELGLSDLGTGADDDLDPTIVPVERARAINESMKKAGTDTLPNVLTRFLAVGDDSVTVRKVWRRPLAIGVRGITMEIDRNTGDILRMGPMGQPLRSR